MDAPLTSSPLTSTPLLGLDWVALDTETTSLDPRVARIVEIAVLPGRGIAAEPAGAESHRVAPGVAIPQAATRVHGIDDAALAAAPPFGDVWHRLAPLLTGRILIGHTLGYDIAVLERECGRAGLPFEAPRRLDVRLLAHVVHPGLADVSLDALASFFEVTPGPRHSALGDAETAARLFAVFVPLLREAGIRTLGEAEAACRSRPDVMEAHHRAGYAEPAAAPAASHAAQMRAAEALVRIDSQLYRHRIRDVMTVPPFALPGHTTVAAAVRLMAERGLGSVLVRGETDAPLAPADTGIVTERDILRGLTRYGAGLLERPVSDLASRPVGGLPADAFLYRAAGRMQRRGIRHLAALDAAGEICGMLSVRDVLRPRVGGSFALDDAITAGEDPAELAKTWAGLPLVAGGLVADGVPARDVAAVISSELGALTARAAELAEAELGPPPAPYALLVLGSAGRGESLLAMDQDNALLIDAPPGQDVDGWFAAFGARVADILHAVGVPYCPGGVMAREADWRGTPQSWRHRLEGWIRRARPQDLLSVDIFYDFACVHGAPAPAAALFADAYAATRGHFDFLKLLAEAGGESPAALGLFGAIRTENGRVDLKRCGLFPIVRAARILAIAHGVRAHATPARLDGLAQAGLGAARDLSDLIHAHAILLAEILHQQIEDAGRGVAPSNKVEPGRLDATRRATLKEALRIAAGADAVLHTLLMAQRTPDAGGR
ncbi:DUF294 nucleotidyltransferase-like domain-containing protein [Aquabacter spiritensis]|uniref:DNA polymerase-3 subunit epsilon/CBS domain-containing protein n=1 Tax=Aquabacter spiritensis TaxID=933073 RepID=A0A4R3LP20_9HYPH|nr:DUF294 nucleotidyltransferase-like domain-containing protein [Aquabacter spiritensis]TCT02223.1 DNA polymerase-3 subunit epsilon/CBS domain-containing protein [Aquabacter spiritensis]